MASALDWASRAASRTSPTLMIVMADSMTMAQTAIVTSTTVKPRSFRRLETSGLKNGMIARIDHYGRRLHFYNRTGRDNKAFVRDTFVMLVSYNIYRCRDSAVVPG